MQDEKKLTTEKPEHEDESKERASEIMKSIEKRKLQSKNSDILEACQFQTPQVFSRKLALASWSCSCFSKLSDGVDAPQKPQIID